MTKNLLGQTVKEYELLLLFGGKISKSPKDSDDANGSEDLKVSSHRVRDCKSYMKILFWDQFGPEISSIFAYKGTSALDGEWHKIGRMRKPRSGFGVEIISWVLILNWSYGAPFSYK